MASSKERVVYTIDSDDIEAYESFGEPDYVAWINERGLTDEVLDLWAEKLMELFDDCYDGVFDCFYETLLDLGYEENEEG